MLNRLRHLFVIPAACALSLVVHATPTLIEDQSFTGATGSTIGSWKIQDNAVFTTATQSNTVAGNVVQLTSSANNQVGLLIYDKPFSTSLGVEVDFDYYVSDAGGADGLAFFLIDGSTTSVTHGQVGGALGYGTNYTTVNGLSKGYLAVGFDEYGGSVISGGNSTGTMPNNGSRVARVISLLGSGDGLLGYRYLAGVPYAGFSSGWQRASILTRRGTGSNGCIDGAICLTAKVSADNGATWTTIYNATRVDNLNGQFAIPSTFKMGFSASTGGLVSQHLIDNVQIYYDNTGYDVSVTKSGTGSGTITSTSNPSQGVQLNCGTTCTTAYLTGTSVSLSATADAGSLFNGWTGNCSGSLPTSIQIVTSSVACNAVFTLGKTVTASAGANGSISPASIVILPGASTSLSIVPNQYFSVDTVSGCGGTLNGSTYTTGAVAADCTVTATFRSSHDTKIQSKGGIAAAGILTLALLALLVGCKVTRRLFLILPFLVLMISSTAHASSGFYVSGAIGGAFTNVKNDDINSEMNSRGMTGGSEVTGRLRLAWRALCGYSFSDALALEAGYTQLGQLSTQFNGTGTFDTSSVGDYLPTSGAGPEASGVFRLPIGAESIGLVRVGAMWWKSSFEISGGGNSQTITQGGTALVTGIGLEGQVTPDEPRLRMRVEVDRYGLPRYATYTALLSLSFDFGRGALSSTTSPPAVAEPIAPPSASKPTEAPSPAPAPPSAPATAPIEKLH